MTRDSVSSKKAEEKSDMLQYLVKLGAVVGA
jgi:hypothetical protein